MELKRKILVDGGVRDGMEATMGIFIYLYSGPPFVLSYNYST